MSESVPALRNHQKFVAKHGKASGMNSSPIAVSIRPGRKEDLVYQVVTVAAMVTMLATIWIF
jgi:hypothetical protein